MENTESKQSLGMQSETDSENSSKECLVHEVPGTAFTVVESEQGVFIALGKYRLTEPVRKEPKTLIKEAKKVTWDKVMAVVGIFFTDMVKAEIKLEIAKSKKEEIFKPE